MDQRNPHPVPAANNPNAFGVETFNNTPPPRYRSLYRAGLPLSLLGDPADDPDVAAAVEGLSLNNSTGEVESQFASSDGRDISQPKETQTLERLTLENAWLKRQLSLQARRLTWLESRYDLLSWRLCGTDSWSLKGHHQLGVLSCRLSPVEGFLASGSADKCILQWDIRNGVCTQRLRGHTAAIHSLHSEGNFLVSGSADRTICIWNFTTGEFVGTLKGHTGTVYRAILREGLIVSGASDRSIRVWAFAPGQRADGELLAGGARTDTPSGEDEETGRMLRLLEGHCGSVSSLCFHPWQKNLLISGSYDANVALWDLETGACLRTLRGHESFVNAVACSETIIASASNDCTVRLWDLRSQTPIVALQRHTDWVKDVQIQGSLMVSAGKDGNLMFWDFLYHDCLRVFKAHQHEIHHVELADNLLVTASEDRTLKVVHFKKLVL